MKYKHIVFDVDGTLVDNEYATLYSLIYTLKSNNIEIIDPVDLLVVLGITGEAGLKQLGIDDYLDVIKSWNQNLLQLEIPIQLFDEIEDVLIQLKSNGYLLGIVTSKTQDEYDSEIRKYGIDQYFNHFVFADMTDKHKPDGTPLVKYMELSGAKPQDILYIGDSVYDKLCAQSANVDFAAVNWGTPRKDELDGLFKLNTPNEILTIV